MKGIQKALADLIKENEDIIFSLKEELEISKMETKLYKTLLEEKDTSILPIDRLYVLEITLNDYYKTIDCIGVFSLESTAIKTMIKGVKSKSWITPNSFNIHKVKLHSPYTKESKLKILFSDLRDIDCPSYEDPQFICGLKVDNEIYLFDNENGNENVEYPYEEITLDKIDDDHFD